MNENYKNEAAHALANVIECDFARARAMISVFLNEALDDALYSLRISDDGNKVIGRNPRNIFHKVGDVSVLEVAEGMLIAAPFYFEENPALKGIAAGLAAIFLVRQLKGLSTIEFDRDDSALLLSLLQCPCGSGTSMPSGALLKSWGDRRSSAEIEYAAVSEQEMVRRLDKLRELKVVKYVDPDAWCLSDTVEIG